MSTDLAGRWLTRLRWLVPAALLLLTLLQFWQGKPASERADQDSARAAALWANQPPRFPLEALNQSWALPAARSPLAIFDSGDGPWLGSSLFLQLGKLARSQDQLGYDYFAAGRHLDLSAALLLQVAIPAIAILIAWRRGGAFASQAIAMLETVGPGIAVTLAAAALLESSRLGADSAARLLLILPCYLLYALAALGICHFVFRWTRSTETAIALLAVFWLLNATIARPVSVNLAAAFYPLPTLESVIQKLDHEVRMGYQGADPRADRDRRHIAEALRDYKVNSIQDLPVNLSAILLKKEERHQREVYDRRLTELRGLFENQERFERYVGFLFPQIAIQVLSQSLAATDFPSERWQLSEADAQWDKIVQRVYDDVIVSSGPEGKMAPLGPEYWRKFAPVATNLPPAAFALQAGLLPLISLGLWILAGLLVRRQETQS